MFQECVRHGPQWQTSLLGLARLERLGLRGCRPYANGIAQLLDPAGDLFGGRIIAKESLEGGNALQIEKRLMQACSSAAPAHA